MLTMSLLLFISFVLSFSELHFIDFSILNPLLSGDHANINVSIQKYIWVQIQFPKAQDIMSISINVIFFKHNMAH